MPEIAAYLFITFRWLDALDILLVSFLLYQVYHIVRGTVAINIFAGILSFYLLWLFVKALNMQLLGSILGQFIGVGCYSFDCSVSTRDTQVSALSRN
jgi:DNA integrity scanning protein DisA with diadenylate cyclase activity